MYLFTIIAIPAFLMSWILSKTKQERLSFIPAILWGFLGSSLFCAIKAFFFISEYIQTASYLNEFIRLFLLESFLPCVILCGLFVLFSKDSVEYKINCFIPLVGSFYAVFVPYKIFSLTEPLSFFPLFVKPVLFISMVIFCAFIIQNIYSAYGSKSIGKIILLSILLLANLCIPALMETWWYFGGKFYFYTPVAVIYAVAAFIVYFLIKQQYAEDEPVFMNM